jgi:formylglycine-generating enzyme required for sulfatase activity
MKQHLPLLLVLFAIAAAPTTKPADRFQPYTEHVKGTLVKIDMVPIKGGRVSFAIGKAQPKEMQIKSFWMAKTECTWDQFFTFAYQLDLPERERKRQKQDLRKGPDAQTRPSFPYFNPSLDRGEDGYPVINIHIQSAMMYCRWLSEKTGRKYRLPTEAEWEYACRAGSSPTKLSAMQLDDYGWHHSNSEETTHPVMQKKPNEWGLYDMLGNAGEWCTPIEGKPPVLRGGSYVSKPADVSCLARSPFDPSWQERDTEDPKSNCWLYDGPFAGFRVVREE